jgi:hypothetical protein
MSGDGVVWLTPVAVTGAVVRRDGRVQAGGHPADHARLGVAREWLDELCGIPGAIDQITRAAVLEGRVKGHAAWVTAAELAHATAHATAAIAVPRPEGTAPRAAGAPREISFTAAQQAVVGFGPLWRGHLATRTAPAQISICQPQDD